MSNKRLSIGKAAKHLGVSLDTLRRWDAKGKLPAKRSKGGHRYYSRLDLDLYKEDLFAQTTKWILGPATKPKDEFYCATSLEFKGRLSSLQATLERKGWPENYLHLIVAITGEIGNNSYDHNIGRWPDIFGTFFAFDANKGQIALADRGLGIFRTLKPVRSNIKNDVEALQVAFTETLSGRISEPRGNGLKFVQKIVLNNPIKLAFYSGDAMVDINNKQVGLKFSKIDTYYSGCLALITFSKR